MGTFVSGFIPFFRALNPRANFSTFSSIINGQLKEGFGIAAPDLTVTQLNRLDNVVLHDGLTIPNNSQAKTTVFFPRHVINITKQEKKIIDGGSMYPVIDKLGELVIVGKPLLAFKNREIVATKPGAAIAVPTPVRSPAPEPAGGLPRINTRDADDHPTSIIITGTNLLNVSEVTMGGLSSRIMAVTDTNLTVAVPNDPVSGDVIITSRGGPRSL